MASITLKNVPEELLAELHTTAELEHRSVNQQAILLLKRALKEPSPAREAAEQVSAWQRLAGSWPADGTLNEELKALRKSRSKGRKVKL